MNLSQAKRLLHLLEKGGLQSPQSIGGEIQYLREIIDAREMCSLIAMEGPCQNLHDGATPQACESRTEDRGSWCAVCLAKQHLKKWEE